MNAGPAGTRSPHLDLGDLIAEVTSQPIDDRAREHLARCEHCRAEASRWDLVAAGVRLVNWDLPAELSEVKLGPPITYDDLLAFHFELESEDWFEHMIAGGGTLGSR